MSTDLVVVKWSSCIASFYCACCFLACALPSLSFLTFSLTRVFDFNHLARPLSWAYLSSSSSSDEEAEESLEDPQSLPIAEAASEPDAESESCIEDLDERKKKQVMC